MLYLRVLHGQTNFGKKCKENPARFEKTNQTEDGKKMNIPQKDLKVKNMCTRDITGTSCVFGSGTESRVGARDVISYDNGSSITCSY